ncbi:MAG TPA: S8 family serine peptidase [Solirubrobacteraceae bacterium]|jgi:thermitase
MNRALKAGLLAGALALVPATAASAAPYDAHTVIVKYDSGISSAARAALDRRAGVIEKVGSVTGVGATVVRVTGDPQTVAARLNRSAGVNYAEPNYLLRATATPNDPRFGELYGLNNSNDADMDAPEGWDAFGLGTFPATGGVKVGIVDTGIDKAHEDLQNKVVNCADATGGTFGFLASSVREGTCADDNDHGTHVAGTIAATANNGKGVTGVAFNSPLAICKALGGPLGQGSTAGVANCIAYLNGKGAKIISMSLGGGASTTLQQAVKNASGTSLLIAAAGNDGDGTLNYPAAYPEVVSVAATDRNDQRASFSNANADVEIAAAGVDVLSTWRGGGYTTMSGTSMATPHISGVAALIAGKGGTPSTWRSKLDSSVDDLGPAGRDPVFGFGRVNLVKAGS